MYWFPRPPNLRLGVAALLLIAGFWAEFRPVPTTLHPFATVDIAAGQPLTVEWRPVPLGLLPPVADDAVAARPILAGEPLTPSMVSTVDATLPDGWWALPLPLPTSAASGQAVRVVVTEPGLPPRAYDGLVLEPAVAGSTFDYQPPEGLVAVPGEAATAVAAAAADGRITVLLGPP